MRKEKGQLVENLLHFFQLRLGVEGPFLIYADKGGLQEIAINFV